ncbi:hypothetical protein BH09ACT8_BH09ACT8_11830 [soil metagenome]
MGSNLVVRIHTGLTPGVTLLTFDSNVSKSPLCANTVVEQLNSTSREEAIQ